MVDIWKEWLEISRPVGGLNRNFNASRVRRPLRKRHLRIYVRHDDDIYIYMYIESRRRRRAGLWFWRFYRHALIVRLFIISFLRPTLLRRTKTDAFQYHGQIITTTIPHFTSPVYIHIHTQSSFVSWSSAHRSKFRTVEINGAGDQLMLKRATQRIRCTANISEPIIVNSIGPLYDLYRTEWPNA